MSNLNSPLDPCCYYCGRITPKAKIINLWLPCAPGLGETTAPFCPRCVEGLRKSIKKEVTDAK